MEPLRNTESGSSIYGLVEFIIIQFDCTSQENPESEGSGVK
jgi:hypothetical protein